MVNRESDCSRRQALTLGLLDDDPDGVRPEDRYGEISLGQNAQVNVIRSPVRRSKVW
jgi:hypothetical protein